MKKVLVFVFLATLAADSYAQQTAVAVAPFEAVSGNVSSDAQTLADIFEIEFQAKAAGIARVYTRSNFQAVMNEHRFQMSDLSDDQKTAALGKGMNANWVVRGKIQKLGQLIIVTVTLLDVNNLEVMAGAPMRLDRIEEAANKMDDFVELIVQRIRGGGTTVRPASGTVPEGFVRVEGGTFQMGSSNGESDEKPVHTVTVTGFYMGRHEVTQKEWTELMGTTVRQQRDQANRNWSLYGEGDNYPMYYISWYEAVEYCNKRSIREGLTPAYRGSGTGIVCDFTASGYRLPTEAEWEYAAKGGNKDFLTYEYAGGNNAGAAGWYDGNSGGMTHPVETKQPNSLGLYDMSGNVWEWCWDWYSSSYSSGSQTDPAGPASGANRVARGGSWSYSAANLRSSDRSYSTPGFRSSYLGFRLVRP